MSITDYFEDEPTNSKVFRQTVATTTVTDISNIVIISVTGISKNSKSTQANKMRLTSNSVNFIYEISQSVADANAGDAWFSRTSNKLTTSVSNGEFTNLLQTKSIQSTSSAFATANASVIPSISDPVITVISEPQNTGEKENTISAALISGIVILVIFVIGSSFLCYRNKNLIYQKMNWKKATKDIETGGTFVFLKY